MLRILVLSVIFFAVTVAPAAAGEFFALCYHDVQDKAAGGEGMAVTRAELIAQFGWLREHGFVPVSVADLLATRRGERVLPEKAVLLTFDDGYASFYSQVFPLLKAFDYPAVLGLVGRWLEAAPGERVAYGRELVPRERFMSWEQISEVAASGLVEIASHSYDLHRGVVANPQGNTQPAMTARIYDGATRGYESDEAFRQRLRDDFARNASLLQERLGLQPRVMVWPYGEYNRIALDLAREAGMPLSLSLSPRPEQGDDSGVVGRHLIPHRANLADLAWTLRHPRSPAPAPRRVLHVDLDYVFDADSAQQERNLGRLLDRVLELGVNTVYLQAFADPDGDGVADSLYFPNRHLPVRADLFNRVAWQLRTRTGAQVYAWMPVLAFALGQPQDLVLAWRPDGSAVPAPERYRRLSPFSPQAARWVGEIFQDLAKHAAIAGLLFHDDAFLTDYEDAHPAALAAYRAAGLPETPAALHSAPQQARHWTRLKTAALNRFIAALVEQVRVYRPEVKTARNLYALAVLDRASEAWFAQSLPRFLEHYDYTAVMAMPYMEGARDPESWLRELVDKIAEVPGALERVVFELQSRDWRSGTQIPAQVLARHLALLQSRGAIHYGYYPDDFLAGRPAAAAIMPWMSAKSSPYRP